MQLITNDGREMWAAEIWILARNETEARAEAYLVGIPWARCCFIRSAKQLRGLRGIPVWLVGRWFENPAAYEVERMLEQQGCFTVRGLQLQPAYTVESDTRTMHNPRAMQHRLLEEQQRRRRARA